MPGVIETYRKWLGLPDVKAISLGEGATPLIPWATWQSRDIWLKLEGLNPTGSFKDRGMTVAVSMALHEGHRAVLCASTGNTAASAAAYAGRAGIPAFVTVPEGQVTQEKMLQAAAYGAHLLAIQGNFDEALAVVRHLVHQDGGIALVNSVNPWRLRGQETSAFEIVDQLGHAPDSLVLPVGNAGNISAYFQGFTRYGRGVPRMLGIQADGANPLVRGSFVDDPSTLAQAIKIGKPASADKARHAVKVSHGQFLSVSDDAILSAQQELAHGGVYVEPASAAAYAGLREMADAGSLPEGPVVVILTGSGLKDGTAALRWTSVHTTTVTQDTMLNTIQEVIGDQHVAR